jgi:hypothetical protein
MYRGALWIIDFIYLNIGRKCYVTKHELERGVSMQMLYVTLGICEKSTDAMHLVAAATSDQSDLGQETLRRRFPVWVCGCHTFAAFLWPFSKSTQAWVLMRPKSVLHMILHR